jgi:hypothetical protein
MKSFTELTNENDFVADFLDQQLSEYELMTRKINPTLLCYGLIATNWALEHKLSYEILYALFVHLKPQTQEDFDEILDAELAKQVQTS